MPLDWVLLTQHSSRREFTQPSPHGFAAQLEPPRLRDSLSSRLGPLGPRLGLLAPSQLEKLDGYRVHLYFYHTAGAPAPREKGPQGGTDEAGQLGGALDDEAPARGRRRAGRPQRRGWIDDESRDAGESGRALIEESTRRRGRLAAGGDMAEALVRGIAELGTEAELLLIEGFARAVPDRGQRVVIGMERLGDHATGAAHGFSRGPEELEDALARAKIRDAKEAVQPHEADRTPPARAAAAQQRRRAYHDLGAGIGAGDGESRKAAAHRGLDPLGVPAEGPESPSAAGRAPVRERLDAGAEAADESATVPADLEGHRAVGTAQEGATVIAAQDSGGTAHHESDAAAAPRHVLDGAGEGQRERMVAQNAAGVRRDDLRPGALGIGKACEGAVVGSGPALDRRRSREEDEAAAVEGRASHQDVARMQSRRPGRFVSGVLLLEEDKRGRGGQGREESAAGAHDHARATPRGREPGFSPHGFAGPAVEPCRVQSPRPASGARGVWRDDERGLGLGGQHGPEPLVTVRGRPQLRRSKRDRLSWLGSGSNRLGAPGARGRRQESQERRAP